MISINELDALKDVKSVLFKVPEMREEIMQFKLQLLLSKRWHVGSCPDTPPDDYEGMRKFFWQAKKSTPPSKKYAQFLNSNDSFLDELGFDKIICL